MKYFLFLFMFFCSLAFFSCLRDEIKPVQRSLDASWGISKDTLIVDSLVDTSIKIVSYFLPFKISLNQTWVRDVSSTAQHGTPSDSSTSNIKLSFDSNLTVKPRYCLATIEGDYELYGRVNPKRKLVIQQNPTYFINFNSDTITLDYFETNKDFLFLSNSDLTISFNANSWLTQSVSDISNDINRTLSITTTHNSNPSDRYASCVISNALTNVSASYVIRQKAVGYLRVSPSKLTISAEVGDNVSFNIESNTNWSVDLGSISFGRFSYLTQSNLTKVNGSGNGTVTLVTTEESTNYTYDVNDLFNVAIPNTTLSITLKRLARKCANYKAERQVLEDLYNDTDGDNWTKKSNWLSQDDTGYRNWHGVLIRSDNGCIVSLSLFLNNMKGSVPKSISNLTQLTHLYLGYNDIKSLPSTIGNLTKLQALGVNGNKLLTSLPTELWNLPNIVNLDLSDCVGLDYNDLFSTGAGLTNLTTLNDLRISSIPLNQSLPNSFFTSMKNLEILFANSCNIGATSLSSFFTSFPNITFLVIFSNSFNQSIPTSINNLTKITYLYLSNNGLTGPIPNMNNLSNLKTFDLSNNGLTGPIPNMNNLSNLRELFLSNNSLSGSIPISLGDLDSLSSLNLSNNNLSGNIPSNLGSGVRLSTLSSYETQNGFDFRAFDLSNNNLTGTIPTSLCTIINNGLKARLNCNASLILCDGSTPPCP